MQKKNKWQGNSQRYHKIAKKILMENYRKILLKNFVSMEFPLVPDKSAYKYRNWLKCYKAFKQYISEFNIHHTHIHKI